jgi:hypothetical protein
MIVGYNLPSPVSVAKHVVHRSSACFAALILASSIASSIPSTTSNSSPAMGIVLKPSISKIKEIAFKASEETVFPSFLRHRDSCALV